MGTAQGVARAVVALAVLLASLLWAGPVAAQFFVRPDCTTISSPQLGWTCSETSTLTIKQYNGTTWAAAAGGAILNGLTGPVSLLGTANQIGVVTGGSSITISAAQNIASSSSPTFAGLTLSGLGGAGTQCVQVDNAGVLGVSGGGACGGGGGAGVSSLNLATGGLTLAGVANRTTVSTVGATITVSLPDDVSGLTSLSAGTLNASAAFVGPVRDQGGMVYNVKAAPFSLAGGCNPATGLPDDRAAFLAGLAAVPNGATILFGDPTGVYCFSDTVTALDRIAITITGPSTTNVTDDGAGPVIVFTQGTGTRGFHFDGCRACTLRGLNIAYKSAAYSGTLIDLDKVAGLNATDWTTIEGNRIGGLSGATGANALIKIGDTFDTMIRRNTFRNAQRAILGGVSGEFANGVELRGNTYVQGFTVCHVVAGGQGWTIADHVHEPMDASPATACALDTTNRGVDGLVYTTRWLGDASAGTWIKATGGPLHGATFSGISVQGVATATGFALGASNGVHFAGNAMDLTDTDIDFGTATNVTGVRSNFYNGLGPKFAGAPGGLSDWNYGSVWRRTTQTGASGSTLAIGTEATSFIPWMGWAITQGSGNTQNYAISSFPAARMTQVGTLGNAFRLQVAAGGTAGNPVTWTSALDISTAADATWYGNLGIGVAPTVALDIQKSLPASTLVGRLFNTDTGSTSHAAWRVITGSLGEARVEFVDIAAFRATIASTSADDLVFRTSSSLLDRLTITSAGLSIFKTNTSALPAAPSGSVIQLAGVTGAVTGLALDTFGDGAISGPQSEIHLRRAGGTPTARTALLANYNIGALTAEGAYNATSYSGDQASLGFFTGENWSSTNLGTYMTFGVTPLGSTVLTEALRIAGITGGQGFRVSMTAINAAPSWANSRPLSITNALSGIRTPTGTDFVESNSVGGLYVAITDASVPLTGIVGPPTDCKTGIQLGLCTSTAAFFRSTETSAFQGTAYNTVSLQEINGSTSTGERGGHFGGTFANSGSGFAAYGHNGFVGVASAVTSFGLVDVGLWELNCQISDCATKAFGVQAQNINSPFGQSQTAASAFYVIPRLGTIGGFTDGEAWTYAFAIGNQDLTGLRYAVHNAGRVQMIPTTALLGAGIGALDITVPSASNGAVIALGESGGSYKYVRARGGHLEVVNNARTTNLLDLDDAGGLKIESLKTTGAAGSKKVVCVDTATGQLYASSTGTDCSN